MSQHHSRPNPNILETCPAYVVTSINGSPVFIAVTFSGPLNPNRVTMNLYWEVPSLIKSVFFLSSVTPWGRFDGNRANAIQKLKFYRKCFSLQRSVCRQTEEKISKAFGLGNRGSVSLTAKTDRGAYCPGEKIAVSRKSTVCTVK